VGGTKVEYMEYIVKFTYRRFNWESNFANFFLNFIRFVRLEVRER